MTSRPVDIAAVVVTYNSEPHIADFSTACPGDGRTSYSVVVVDNGSTDGPWSSWSHATDCLVVRSSNDGYAAGINRAVQASPELRDPHPQPRRHLDPSRCPGCSTCSDGRGGLVAPRVREEDGTLSPTLRRGPTWAGSAASASQDWPAFTERIEDPQRVRDRARGGVGGRRDPPGRPTVLRRPRRYGRVLLPVLGGDRLQPERQGRWVGDRVHPRAGAMHVGGGSGESATTHTMKIINRVRLYRRRRGTLRASVYFGLTVLTELRRALLGHDKSWPPCERCCARGTAPRAS